MWPLRKATASQLVPLGPFVSSTDFDTAQTGLTIDASDIHVYKSGASGEVAKNSGAATHMAGGRYKATLDATDTDTVGPLRLSVHVAGALPVTLDCIVLEHQVYDALYKSGALFGTDVITNAILDEPLSGHNTTGTVGAAMVGALPLGATGIVAASPAPTASTFKVSSVVGSITSRAYAVLSSGALQGETCRVQSYDSGTGNVILGDALTTAPTAGDTVSFIGFH